MIEWTEAGQFTDIKYHKTDGIAKITINRPEVRNAFRPLTVEEMIQALDEANNDPTIGVVILTGEGKEAFCSGGDQKVRGDSGYKDAAGVHRLNVLDFQRQMRSCPMPVIAMVAGYAVGGGHVLHVMCDLTIAADKRYLRADRPACGLLRRRLRRYLPGAHRRPEEGARDLVPVPAVQRPGSAGHGAGERGGALRAAGGRDGPVVP